MKAAAEAFIAMHRSIHAAAGIYADDAVLELNVPRWRFQLAGPSAITEGFAGSFPDGFTIGHSRWEPTPSGVVVEYDGHDVATGDYYRHLALPRRSSRYPPAISTPPVTHSPGSGSTPSATRTTWRC